MDPISAAPVHWSIWEPFVPRRSKIPSINIDLLLGARGGPEASILTASPPQLLPALQAVPSPAAFEDLLRYLLSDDTALPSHPILSSESNCASAGLLDELARDEAEQAERRQQRPSGVDALPTEADQGDQSHEQVEMPEVDEAHRQLLDHRRESIGASWVQQLDSLLHRTAGATTLNISEASRNSDGDYGIVLCGAYGCVDDAQWATSTRSIQCRDLHDLFMTLRMSSKLSMDLKRQMGMNDSVADEEPTHSESVDSKISSVIARTPAQAPSSATTAILRLTQYKGIGEGAEFRAFVLIEQCGGEDPFEVSILGLCQKRVDQVFEFLLDDEHNKALAGAAEETIVKMFTSKSNNDQLLCQALFRHLTGDAAAADTPQSKISDIVLGVDITIESPSLPVYVLGISAVAVGTPEHPFLSVTEKNMVDGRIEQLDASSIQVGTSSPFHEAIIDKQSIPFCRLYRTLSNLRQMYLSEAQAQPKEERANLKRTIFVASDQSDLVGDGKQMFSHTALPKELTDTESLLAALQNGGDGADPELAAFIRHLQNQRE